MRKTLLGLAVVALSTASACTRHAGPQEACALLPKSVAESVLQVELGAARSQRFGENPRQVVISNCQYVATKPEPLRSLTFTIRAGGVPDSSVGPAEGLISTMKQTFGQRYDLKKLSGLGNGAVWDPSLHQLTVFAGTSTYVWAAPGATVPNLEDKLVTLAKRTIARS
jgi:hypothetical protein